MAESTSACDTLKDQLEALLEEADEAVARGDVETVKSLLAKSRLVLGWYMVGTWLVLGGQVGIACLLVRDSDLP